VVGGLARCGEFLISAYLPAPALSGPFWDTNFFYTFPHPAGLIFDEVGWLMLFGFAATFRRAAARYFYLAGSGLLLLQFVYSGRAYMHHLGWLFVCLVLALVLENTGETSSFAGEAQKRRWQRWILGVTLACQVYAGLFALGATLREPFSVSKQVAGYLRAQGLADAPMAFEPDLIGSSVLAYLQRPTAYDLELRRPTSFIPWNRAEYLNQHVPGRADMADFEDGRTAPVLITGRPLRPAQQAELGVHLLAAYESAANPYDAYFIYR
jgi:hypothetical protein